MRHLARMSPWFRAALAVGLLLVLLGWRPPSARAALAGSNVPVLVITSGNTNEGAFIPEVLKAEGLNHYTVADISNVDATTLAGHDVVILAKMALPAARVTDLTNWVQGGGRLIAFQPDAQLAPLLGLSPQSQQIANGYLLVDDSSLPGNGITRTTMQFHGSADAYLPTSARVVATLYRDAATATPWPAVTLNAAGSGQAAAFTYDLASSLVWTRQGNPAWAATERDGVTPIRSDDKFYGPAANDPQPDWVDHARIGIPQADEQQRLLANLLLVMNQGQRPLPRFWYLPQGRPVAVVMTGDDHGNGGTSGRFDQFISASPAGCVVAQWQCVRATSYVYPSTPITDTKAASYDSKGFEISLHVTTNCADYDATSLTSMYDTQLQQFATSWPSLPAPVTERHHCVVWSDWASGANVERAHGMRLDTTYYMWPGSWINDTPGYMTGSAMPMPYMGLDGTPLGVYQAITQMTDESSQSYPATIDTLLDNAIGPNGYYGVLTVNAHDDQVDNPVADAVLASAQARGVAIVSARQMLTWLDGRNASSFNGVAWNGSQLSFTISAGTGANGLQAMVPMEWNGLQLQGLTVGGTARSWTLQPLKGLDWAMFNAASGGSVVATYGPDTTPPAVTSRTPAAGATSVDPNTTVSVAFGEAIDPTTVTSSSVKLLDASGTAVGAAVRYDAFSHAAVLQPSQPLAYNATYQVVVVAGAVKDLAGNAAAGSSASFTTGQGSTSACPCSVWPDSATPAIASDSDTSSVELGMRFTSDTAGYITGIRFYKGPTNTGTHVGSLWDASGNRLASVTFVNETSTGWQKANLSTPVAIAPNTIYVVSYLAPHGGYSTNNSYFATSGVDAPPLHVPQDGVGGHNDVYVYGSGGVFPTNSYQATNYWVDVVYSPTSSGGGGAPTVISTSPASGATGQNVGVAVSAVFSEALDPTTVNGNTFELRDGQGNLVAATIGWNPESDTAMLWPSSPLSPSTTYTARLHGGSTDPRIKDLSGQALASDVTWSFTTAALTTACASPANAIVRENCLAGANSSEWDVSGVGDTSIEGFATSISATPGQSVNFKVNTTASDWRIDVYRLGWYGGAGARHVARLSPSVAQPQSQPACLTDSTTGLVDCGNWAVSATWTVPAGAVSGVYIAKLTRNDTGGASHIPVVVRNDASTSAVIVQTSDTTWQAYNDWSGNSLYTGGPGTNPARAYKVSYNRPWHTRGVDSGQDWIFNAEYPMWRFLERNGYDLTYTSGIDVERSPSLLTNHRLYLSVGHDEYWSGGQRAAVTSARDAGVNLAFLSGNTGFWKTRWESSIDGSGTAYRTLVCYKETHANAKIDPTPTWTGTWRDPRFSPPSDGGRPEDALNGPIFMVNDGATTSIQVPAADGKMRLWRNTSIANLAAGTTATLPNGTLGYEWDVPLDEPSRPGGLFYSSTTTVTNAPVLQDYGSTYASGTAVHHLTLYKAASGARVFSTGSVQWSWGLDATHDRTATPTDVNMQQATVNQFADLGAQPATLMSGLVAATASTDNTPPTSTITSPASGATLAPNVAVTISGTATDAASRVGGVEVSTDGGSSWHPASGRGSWTYSWTPTTNGTFTLLSRATDDSANTETPSAGVTVTVNGDTTPPTVTGKSPAPGATGVPRTTTVTVTFSEAMDPSTITTKTIILKKAGTKVTATVTYDPNTFTATLTPSATLGAVTQYTVNVRGGTTAPVVKDVAGNALASTVSWKFTTGN